MLVAACAGSAAPFGHLDAQHRIQLPAASASHPEEISGVMGVSEMADGRVVVTDGPEQRLLLLDFTDGSAVTLGRRGQGPGEFSSVGFVFPLGLDSALVSDLSARRWLLVWRGQIVRTVPAHDPAVVATRAIVESTDERGHVLSRQLPTLGVGTHQVSERDSLRLMLVSRESGRASTIAMLRRRPFRTTVRKVNERGDVVEGTSRAIGVLSAEEAACLLRDGTVVIARLVPFRVDVRAPDGKWTFGSPLPIPAVKVDARERRAFGARNRGVEVPASRFPEFLPPFERGMRDLTPVGAVGVLIRLTPSADQPGNRYLLITRDGRSAGQLDLDDNSRIIGVSTTSVYVARLDESGLERLHRHALPPEFRASQP